MPIFDTTLVTMNRMLARRRVSVGGRDHISHCLVALGLTERRAVLWLYGTACVSGGVAYLTYLDRKESADGKTYVFASKAPFAVTSLR